MKKTIYFLLLLTMILQCVPFVSSAEEDPSNKIFRPEMTEPGMLMKINRNNSSPKQVMKGEVFSIDVWYYGIAPKYVVLPIGYDPNVVSVVNTVVGDDIFPIRSGTKNVLDYSRGLTGYDLGMDRFSFESDPITQVPIFQRISCIYPDTELYPYLNTETGLYKFLFESTNNNPPQKPQLLLKVFFQAIETGDAQFKFRTIADSNSYDTDDVDKLVFDPGAQDGLEVLFDETTYPSAYADCLKGDYIAVLTNKHPLPSLKVITPDMLPSSNPWMSDEPESSSKPDVGPTDSSTPNTSDPSNTEKPTMSPTPTPTIDPNDLTGVDGAKVFTTLNDPPKMDGLPINNVAKIRGKILPNQDFQILASCEYNVLENDMVELVTKDSVLKPDTVLVQMPPKILARKDYPIYIHRRIFEMAYNNNIKMIYIATPYGYVGLNSVIMLRNMNKAERAKIIVNQDENYNIIINGEFDNIPALDFGGRVSKMYIPYELKEGEVANNLIVHKDEKGAIPLSKYMERDRMMVLTDSSFGKYQIKIAEIKKFTDLEDTPWAKEHINNLSSRGIISGKTDLEFEPNSNITREEFAKILVGTFGIHMENAQCDFSDVKKEDWFYSYVASAYETGIIKGNSNGEFGVNENITREDMTVMVVRAMELVNLQIFHTEEKIIFNDANDIAPYAANAVTQMQLMGVMGGKEGNIFDPKGNATRAEASKVLNSIFKLVYEKI